MIADVLTVISDILILGIIILQSVYTYSGKKKLRREKNSDNKVFSGIRKTKNKRELTEEEKRDIEILELIERYDGKNSFRREE